MSFPAPPPKGANHCSPLRAAQLAVTMGELTSFYPLAYPVFEEIYVSRLLDRDEFRAHCDRHKTRKAILANLD